MENNKYDLGFFPTPVHELKNLSKKYPDYTLFIKRDDHTGLASGGNKTRKLEYLIYEALQGGFDTVITGGAQQSNHCRQTAAACVKAGLECHLVLRGDEPEIYNGNLLLSHLLGAKIHFTGKRIKGQGIDELKTELDLQGKKCYPIPYGGSNLTGSLGYVYAVDELKKQLTEQNLTIDYIFFATSSGGTQAGLILGIDLFDLKLELAPIGIDKTDAGDPTFEENILDVLKEGKKLLNINKDYELNDVKIIKDYNKADYGVVTENERTAIKELARTEGIILDPVYTGRAFFGMMDYLEKKKIRTGTNVLFWHTGGLPANFDYAEELRF